MDYDSEIERSLFRVLHIAGVHSRRFRLSGYDLAQLPREFIGEVGSELVDLFEMRVVDWKEKAPPKPGAPVQRSGRNRAERARGQ